ncbi:hypothetical protein RJ639_019742 [Escallonia herrerae]|uniref:Putative plant transposon protein domain-containing protein n=1 Tax=Escallonia herrerae TaxID=1293975 RepID=A0AA88V5S8_9ASTE|nr:hypothetical protein RJ639_019742 [Escallonia herrerae]
MTREKRARASSSRSRAAPEPEPEPEPIAVEFDQNRYRNREAADRFSAQLSSPLTPGLRLDTPFLFNIGVLRCLQDCYLDRLTDRNTILYYPDAIRLFYANLTWNISSESCTLTSYVFGRRISFSQSRLATLLDLPDSGFSFSLDMIPVAGQSHWFDRPFTIEEQLRHTLHCRQVRVASKPSLRDLPPLSRLFHHIIAYNVIPRTGGLSLVSYLDVQLLTFFRSGTPLNLPRLIMLNMIRSASHLALAIPYGLLLTHILAAFDIPLLGEYIEVTRHIVLDCSTLRRKGLLDDRNRLLPEPELENVIVDDDDEDDDDGDADDDDDDDDDDDAADADDDAGGDAGDGFDRDPPPLIIPSTHEAGTSSGPSTSGYEAILTRLDMMQQHMHAGFSRMDLAHSQLSRRLSRMDDHCGIQCPEEDIFHPPPPPSDIRKDISMNFTLRLSFTFEDLSIDIRIIGKIVYNKSSGSAHCVMAREKYAQDHVSPSFLKDRGQFVSDVIGGLDCTIESRARKVYWHGQEPGGDEAKMVCETGDLIWVLHAHKKPARYLELLILSMVGGHQEPTSLFSLENKNLLPDAPQNTATVSPAMEVLNTSGENLSILSLTNLSGVPFLPEVTNSSDSPINGQPVLPGGDLWSRGDFFRKRKNKEKDA